VEKVTLLIGTQLGKEIGVKPLCIIDRKFIPRDGQSIWYATLYRDVGEWVDRHGISFDLKIISQWQVSMEFQDVKAAILFKMTWM
jgi:hypothetical protein